MKEVLERLPQGVVMFDADGNVAFANRRYSEIYSLPPEHVKPGVPLEALFLLRLGTSALDRKAKHMCRRLREAVRAGEVITGNITTEDGRNVYCINTPLPGGGWIVTHEDVTQQREAERRIEHMVNHDALTDLPNRNAFRERLEHALRCYSQDRLVAVMFIDLDNFKTINDTLGHQVGDELLKVVAERLRYCMSETDMVARFGGDEFVVISLALDAPADAAPLASRIRDRILEPYELFGHHVVVDASIGIALSPNDGTDVDELLKNADLALHSAKGSGRGTYHFFESDMDVRMTERRDLELDLRAALTNGEFELHYQPLVNVKSDRVSCCEALVRWNHPTRGMVPPKDFIPVAEEIGLINRIGEWVIRTACAEAASWPKEVTVAVNVSPVQFRCQNLTQIVTHALASSGLAPQRLEIEITETILLKRTDETLAVLRQLHALGVHITMDDFGTGYSSLGYLQKFPFDKIKIDRAFITDLANEGESIAIVRAVIAIAKSFRMKTAAEGVETERQRAIVASLGCTEIQGNLFSAARPAAEIAEFLGNHASARGAA
ncbi:MAG: EAL domain-containing protein [Novosphingobium sp.]